VDPFVLYGASYKELRESMSGAMYGNQIEELGEATQVLYLFNMSLIVYSCEILYNIIM
jgi:hypothetical protein